LEGDTDDKVMDFRFEDESYPPNMVDVDPDPYSRLNGMEGLGKPRMSGGKEEQMLHQMQCIGTTNSFGDFFYEGRNFYVDSHLQGCIFIALVVNDVS